MLNYVDFSSRYADLSQEQRYEEAKVFQRKFLSLSRPEREDILKYHAYFEADNWTVLFDILETHESVLFLLAKDLKYFVEDYLLYDKELYP